MVRSVCAILAALVLGVASVFSVACTSGLVVRKAGQQQIDVFASVLDETPAEMANAAEVVVRGRVTGKTGAFRVDSPSGDDRIPGKTDPWVYTEWTLVPTKVFKSDGRVKQGRPLSIALREGEAGGVVMTNASEADLKPGEEVVVFLVSTDRTESEKKGRYFTYAAARGVFELSDSGTAKSRDADPLASGELEAMLK